MVSKQDIEALDAAYARMNGQPVPTKMAEMPPVQKPSVQQQPTFVPTTVVPQQVNVAPTPVVKEEVSSKPFQEIKPTLNDSFTPMDLPTRNLDKAIEDWAERRKQHEIDMAYKKLSNMLFQADAPQPVPQSLASPQPQVSQSQAPAPQQVEATPVIQGLDPAVVYGMLDNELLDPKVTNKASLLKIKRRLQGQRYNDEDYDRFTDKDRPEPEVHTLKKNSIGGEQPDQPEQERNYSMKFALAVFGTVLLGALGIGYAIISGIL